MDFSGFGLEPELLKKEIKIEETKKVIKSNYTRFVLNNCIYIIRNEDVLHGWYDSRYFYYIADLNEIKL